MSVRNGPSDIVNLGNGTRDVWLTLPDGRRRKFTFALGNAPGGGSGAKFDSAPDVQAKLSIDGNNHIKINGSAASWDEQLGGQERELGQDITGKYDIPKYVLTLPDGTQYHYLKIESVDTAPSTVNDHQRLIQVGTGIGEAVWVQKLYTGSPQLTEIDDTNGNKLTLSPEGISSSAGTKVQFNRDLFGRITSINGPGLDLGTYSYNDPVTGADEGDLRSVTRLIDSSTRATSTTKFYGSPRKSLTPDWNLPLVGV